MAVSAIDVGVVEVSAKTTWIVLRVRLRDGEIGYGEATRYGDEAAILAEVARLRSIVAGSDLTVPGGVLAAIDMTHPSPARRAAANALEQAMCDAQARRAGLPLGVFLGGGFRSAVDAYANINRGTLDRSPDGFARRARMAADELGYGAVKIAPFDGLMWHRASLREGATLLHAGIDRILATRDAIGRNRRLMVDCHWRLTPMMAQQVLRAVGDEGIFWLEDALDEDAFGAEEARSLRAAAHARSIRIAGGEKVATMAGMATLLARGGVDVVLPDLRLTGIRAGLSILDFAASAGVEVSLHNPAGPVLDAVSLQVVGALPSCLILEGQVGESNRFDEVAGGRAALTNGARRIGEEPGIGIEPRLEFREGWQGAHMAAASRRGAAGDGPNG